MDESLLHPQISVSLITDSVAGFSPTYAIALATVQVPDALPKSCLEAVGLGAHQNPVIAQQIAKAEAAERYALRLVPSTELSFGSWSEDSTRIDPRSLYQLSAKRLRVLGVKRFDEQASYYWTRGYEVHRAQTVQLPADLCYIYRPPDYPQQLALVNSSGLAAHSCREQAELSALLELYERDALMNAWMARYQPPRISFPRLPALVQASVENIQAQDYQCVSVDLSCRGVPVVLAAAYRSRWPALVVCVAARCSLAHALFAVWKEMEVEVLWRLHEQQQRDATECVISMQKVRGITGHFWFYSHPVNTSIASFLWQNPEETSREIDAVVPTTELFNLDTLYRVDYASVLGLEIVRYLTPNLVPGLFGFNQFPVKHPARKTCGFVEAGSRWPGTVIPPHPLA